MRNSKKLLNPYIIFYSVSFILFYLSLLYTGSRSGVIASWVSLTLFAGGYIWLNRKDLSFLKNIFVPSLLILLLLTTFIVGVNLPVINKISLTGVQNIFTNSNQPSAPAKTQEQPQTPPVISALDSGGSSSFDIRKAVWRGGLDAWRANPIIGTGVETFAFAYYKYRPIEHNSFSEWNFLYNKAHNEYINYLTTTGILGLFSYLLFLGFFITLAVINLFNIKPVKYLGPVKSSSGWNKSDPVLLSLLASFLSILIINFFGFSVVILNIYLFLIPAFALILLGLVKDSEESSSIKEISYIQWAGIAGLFVIAFAIIFFLMRSWIADTKYALGANYNRAGEYQTANPLLQSAVDTRREPIFEDELAVNKAILAVGFAQQGGSESAALVQKLATESLAASDKLVREHPHNIVYWKSRVRILYTLSNIDPSFLQMALEATKQTAELAPTDASILYNLGVLYGQNGDSKKAAEILEKTVQYKPNYREAYYALALFYHDLSVNQNGAITDKALHQKAEDKLRFVLENIDPNYPVAKESLDAWEKEK